MGHWEQKKIGDFLTLEYGKPLEKSLRKAGGAYPVYGANGVKDWSDEFYYDKQTVIIGRKGSAGEITLSEEKFWPLDVTYFVRFDETEYDLKFVYFLLSQLDIPSLATGVKPGINRNNVYEITVSCPPINEQKRIVNILDQAFADIEKARANAEQNLKNARELFESYLQQVFNQRGEGWVSERLDNLVTIKHGYAFKSRDFHNKPQGNEPIVLTPGNYSAYGDLYFTDKNTKRCISAFPKEYLFNNGDLTIVMTDLSSQMKILGKPAIIDSDNILHNQRIGRFEFMTKEIVKEYLYYFLLTEHSLKNIRSTETGTMVRHTAPSRILNNVIPYPLSIDKQLKIVESLKEINSQYKYLENIYGVKITNLNQLKKSILQKAFTGQLTKGKAA